MDKPNYTETSAAVEETEAQAPQTQSSFGQVIYLHPALFGQADRENPEPEAA